MRMRSKHAVYSYDAYSTFWAQESIGYLQPGVATTLDILAPPK